MENTIGMTIESIINQDYPNKEIIVIDGGSQDRTVEIIRKYPIKLIKEKLGISNARNLGYKNSSGKFIAFTDGDCELDPLWTKNLLKGFRDDKVGIVGGTTIFRTDDRFSSIYRSLEFSRRYNNIKKEEVVWAGGPCSMFRRKLLDEINGFDPEWVYGEDAEISFIAIENGYKILKVNDAITYHVADGGFCRLIRKGIRDGTAYCRVSKHHFKTSLRNKFNSTWYFPYDIYILPFLYLFLMSSGILLFIMFLLYNIFLLPLFSNLLFNNLIFIWFWLILITIILLFIYGLIPAYQTAAYSKKNKIKTFLETILLHHMRGFAWGLGLIIGIKNLIIN